MIRGEFVPPTFEPVVDVTRKHPVQLRTSAKAHDTLYLAYSRAPGAPVLQIQFAPVQDMSTLEAGAMGPSSRSSLSPARPPAAPSPDGLLPSASPPAVVMRRSHGSRRRATTDAGTGVEQSGDTAASTLASSLRSESMTELDRPVLGVEAEAWSAAGSRYAGWVPMSTTMFGHDARLWVNQAGHAGLGKQRLALRVWKDHSVLVALLAAAHTQGQDHLREAATGHRGSADATEQSVSSPPRAGNAAAANAPLSATPREDTRRHSMGTQRPAPRRSFSEYRLHGRATEKPPAAATAEVPSVEHGPATHDAGLDLAAVDAESVLSGSTLSAAQPAALLESPRAGLGSPLLRDSPGSWDSSDPQVRIAAHLPQRWAWLADDPTSEALGPVAARRATVLQAISPALLDSPMKRRFTLMSPIAQSGSPAKSSPQPQRAHGSPPASHALQAHFVPGIAPPASNMPAAAAAPLHLAWLEELTTELADTPAGEELMADLALLLLALHTRQPAVVRLAAAALQKLPEHEQSKHLLPSAAAHVVGMYLADVLRTAPADASGAIGDCIAALLPASFGLPCGTVHALLIAHTSLPSFWYQRSDSANSAATYVATQRRREESLQLATAASTAWHQYQRAQSACADACAVVFAAARARPAGAMLDERSLLAELSAAWHQHNTPSQFTAAAVWRALRAHMPVTQQDPNSRACIVLALLARAAAVRACDPAAEMPHSRGLAAFARPRLMAAIARTTAVRCLAAAVGAVERLSPSCMPALAVTARATVIPALLQLAHTSYLAYQPLRTACLRMLPALWEHARDAVAADWPLLAHTYVDGVLAAPGTASTPECAAALSDVLATLQGMLSTPTAWLQLFLTTDVAHPLAAAAPHYRTVSRLTTAAAHLIMARGMRSYDGTSRSADTQLPDTADAALGSDSASNNAGATTTMFQPALGVTGPTVWDTDAIQLPELGVAVQPLVREAREMGIFEPADRGRALLDAQRTAVRVLATTARHIMDLSGTVVMGTGDGTPAPSSSRRSTAGANAPTHASRASTGHRGSVSSTMAHKRTSLPSIAVSSASSDAYSDQQLTPPATSSAAPPLPSAQSEGFSMSRTLTGPVPPAATPSKHRSMLSVSTSALTSPAPGFITRRFGGLRTVLTQREQPASISTEYSVAGALVHELVQADAGTCKAWKVALVKHSARKALAALLDAGCVPGAERDAHNLDSAMLACLVRLHAGLWGLEEVGEWLGDEGRTEGVSAEAAESRSALLRQAYFSGLDVAGRPYEDSLRHWLTQGGFKLPGEGQKVGRLVAAFAAVYAAANPPEPGALASVASDAGCLYAAHADAVEILTFSVIMLNTDAHSNAIRAERRMTADQFVRNLRGIDVDSQDLPAAFLKQLYTAIVRRGIKQVVPAQLTPAASSQSTVGRFTPMASDSRRSRVRNRAASTTPLALSTPGGDGSTRASSTSRLSVAGFAGAQGMSIGQPEDVHQKLALDPIHVVPVLSCMHNAAVLDAAELRVQHAAGCSIPVMPAALAWITSAGVMPDTARGRGGQSASVDAVCRAVAQVPLSALQDVALLRYALQTLAANVLPVLLWLLPAAVFGERLHLLHPADVRRDIGAVNAALDCCKFTLSAAVMCGDAGVAEPLLDLLVHLVSGTAAGSKHTGGRRAFAKPKKEPDWVQTIRAGLLAAAAAREVERESSALSPTVLNNSGPVEPVSGTVRALVESMTPQPQHRRHARAQRVNQAGGQHRRARTAAADLSVLAAAAESDTADAGFEPVAFSSSPSAVAGPALAPAGQGYDAADTAVKIGAALSRVHAQVEELRARVANTSNQSALVSMANRFSKQSRTLLMVNRRRRVVHEGVLLKYCHAGTGKVKRYFAVLFSDMLVYARTSWFSSSLRVQRAIPLQSAALFDDPDVLVNRGVEPAMLLQNSEKSLYLAGETAMATLSWRRAIAEALRANAEGE